MAAQTQTATLERRALFDEPLRIKFVQSEHDAKTYLGYVKYVNEHTGFGVIACSETHEIFGCDVPLLHPQLKGFSIGDSIYFKVVFNRAKGVPQALNLSTPPPNMTVQTRPSKRMKREQK